MKLIYGGSTLAAAMLVTGALMLIPQPAAAQIHLSQFPQQFQEKPLTVQKQEDALAATSASSNTEVPTRGSSQMPSNSVNNSPNEQKAVPAPSVSYLATAYSLRGRTASGAGVSKGIIAADPRVLPLGSRVRLEAGGYSGEYMVADTGGAVRGRRIDIWTPTAREALRFGRRLVKLTVLSYGRRHSVGEKSAL